jgi:hypothetical protein
VVAAAAAAAEVAVDFVGEWPKRTGYYCFQTSEIGG